MGIGLTDPDEKLDVAGNISLKGQLILYETTTNTNNTIIQNDGWTGSLLAGDNSNGVNASFGIAMGSNNYVHSRYGVAMGFGNTTSGDIASVGAGVAYWEVIIMHRTAEP